MWRRKSVPAWLGEELVPEVHGRDPRALRSARQIADAAARVGGRPLGKGQKAPQERQLARPVERHLDPAVRAARGSLPWTSGTSSSPSQVGKLLRRPVVGFYSAVDIM